VAYLDAAVCGNSEALRRGEVLVVAGGPATAYEECQDVFATFARRCWRVGGWGAGLKMMLTTKYGMLRTGHFHGPRLVGLPDGELFHTITHG
jgi:3-hydroxyisobutyrate dehydrogenase-like beta-hydroxyacid dehydrogenase